MSIDLCFMERKKKNTKNQDEFMPANQSIIIIIFITLGIPASIVGGFEWTRTSDYWGTHPKPDQLSYLSGFKSINY